MDIKESTEIRGKTAAEKRPDQKILVVDDEEAMRTAMRIILAPVGYKVVTAADPDEALSILESTKDIRLIICDLVMPGMDLREFVKSLHASYPSVDIAFCSGFPKTRFDGLGIRLSDDHFILKPFHPQELRDKVAALL
jgi:CheY-like chemotaxis protein